MKKRALWSVLALCIAVLGYFLVPVDPPPTNNAQVNEVQFSGTSMVEKKGERIVWELQAERIDIDDTTKIMKLTNPKIKYYHEDNKTTEAISQTGVFNQKTRDINLEGAVVVTVSDGSKLQTLHMIYTGRDGKIACTGDVKVNKDDFIGTADKLDSDTALTAVKLSGNAKITRQEGK